ncbi:MAG: hypothetical protein MUE88_09305, partial [Flavobacteriales bacterium]|nr:hypothetical protein [Flavobacteriales bacterium]
MRFCAFISGQVLLLFAVPAQGQSLLPTWPEPNGPVHAIVEDTAQGVVFIGGGFDRIGPPIRGGVPLDRGTGQPVYDAPQANGAVNDVVPDGTGGYFLAGAFTEVDGQPRSRIAHIGPNGQLLPFNPISTAGLNAGSVGRLLLHEGVLYATHSIPATSQTTVAGYSGAVDATTGVPLWEQALTDGPIRAAVPDGQGGWYIAGDFQHVGGLRREGLARIGANGAVHPWYVPVNGPVNTLHRSGDTLYIAGCFWNVLGQDRQYLAGLVLSTNELLPLQTDFGTNFGLYCAVPRVVLRVGERLFVRGDFEWMSDFAFLNEGWLDATTGAAATAPFTLNAQLDDVLQTPDQVFLAGSFTQYNGTAQQGLAIVDRNTYALLPGQLNITGGGVQGLVQGDGVVYLRGSFTAINGQPRSGLAAVDATTLQLLPWAPQVNGAVRAFTFDDGVLHVRGSFTTVNSEGRSGAAALDENGALLPWAPALGSLGAGADVFVRQGDRVLMALPTQSVTTAASQRVVALDATTGAPTGWDVQVTGGGVDDFQLDGDHLFLAGSFASLQDQPRALLGRVALADASLDAWDAQITGSRVRRVEVAGDKVFIAGEFSAIGGLPRSRFGALSRATAQVDALTITLGTWGGSSTPIVSDLRSVGDTLFIVGTFFSVNGIARFNNAALRISTASLLPWNIINFEIGDLAPVFMAIEVSGDTVFLGGSFHSLPMLPGNGTGYHLVAVHRQTGSILGGFSLVYGFPDRLRAIGNDLHVLGVSLLGGQERSGVAAIEVGSAIVQPFQLDVQGEVHALALDAGSLYLGGPITAVNGVPVAGVARVDASTGVLQPFAQPIAWGGQRFAFEVHQGRIFVGTQNGMAVYDALTGAPVAWPHQPNGAVRAMDMLEGRLYFGGGFSQVAGVPRAGGAAVQLADDVLLPWALSGNVSCLSASSEGIAVVLANGAMFAVDPELGQALPVVRRFSDVQPPGAALVAAEDELLIMATGNTVDVTDASISYLENYHLPTGGRTQLSPGYPDWTLVVSGWDLPRPAFIAAMHLGREQVYIGGEFVTISGERRHNLAVYTDLRATLGGVAQDADGMSDALRAQGLLPAQEPYTPLGFAQHLFGGGEGVEAPVFAISDSTAIVDWVLVELRSAADSFPLTAGPYHVALHHRNHLGVMTATAVSLDRSATTVDLRNTPGFGSDAQRPVGGGYALWPGDATGDGVVKYAGAGNDRDALLQPLGGSSPTTTIVGAYDEHDLNLDGVLKYAGANNDRDIILQTIG